MNAINMKRVLIGGLAAGVVINLGEFLLNDLILKDMWEEALQEWNRQIAYENSIFSFVVSSTILGIVLVWIYAGIRPRFGAGPRTALTAGMIVWFLSFAYGSIGWMAMDLFPKAIFIYSVFWGAIEIAIASLLGAWIYKEE